MLAYILTWYVACSAINLLLLYAGTWVYTEKQEPKLLDKGTLLVQLVGTWLVIIAPFLCEGNSLTIMSVIEGNLMTFSISTMLLLFTAVTISMAMQSRLEKNQFQHVLYWVLCAAALLGYFAIVLVIIPYNVPGCPCQDGFFGNACDKTCLVDSVVCSGHGSCGTVGCVCNERFTGTFCNACVNQFDYSSNCTACNVGYSLDLECTTCEQGRDPKQDCQACLEGYLADENYNSNKLGCSVCKENYFRPTSNPLVGSYNKFLEFGDVCTPCEGTPVCNGHGTCRHFLTEGPGNFQYNNKTVLGQLADGECECEVGYAGPSCIKAPAYDLSNSESICNGHGEVMEVYAQEDNDIFETFQRLECLCDDGYVPDSGDDACSCLGELGNCEACIFGYYLVGGDCVACPGGGFLKACGADIGAGVCNAGTCECQESYVNGAYKGESCNECFNDNFFKIKNSDLEGPPEQCQACPGAYGNQVSEACGGHGYCITDTRLNNWQDEDYTAFKGLTAYDGNRDDLQHMIGHCVCFQGYALNMFGLCS